MRRSWLALAPLALLSACQASGPDTVAPGACVGVQPPQSAFTAQAGPLRGDAGVVAPPDGGCAGPSCVGAAMPLWALRDFQPRSCGYNAVYGPDLFRGKAVLLALWAGW